MLAPSRLPPWARDLAASAVHSAWAWASAVGLVGPQDKAGRRFASMGEASSIGFPPGPCFGEERIAIGAGTMVGPHVSLSVGMWPGEELDLAEAPDGVVLRIGDRVNVGRGTSIAARCRVEVGDDVTIAPNAYITDHEHTYADPHVPISHQWPSEAPVVIGAGTWLGVGAVVLPGARLGRNVVVGAGAVVRGEVPDHAVVVGSPGRVVRTWSEEDGWQPPLREVVRRPHPGWEAGLREPPGT